MITPRRFHIRTLMIVVLVAALFLFADQLRRRRSAYLAKAKEYAAIEKAELGLMQAELLRTKERLRWAQRMHERGYVSKASVTFEEFSLRKAEINAQRPPDATRLRLWYEYAADHPWLSGLPDPR